MSLHISYNKSDPFYKKIWDSRNYYFLMLPFLVLFAVFTVLPIIMSWVVGFTNYDMLNSPEFVGFENYIRIFLEDDVFLIALKNTAVLAFVTGPIGYILSFVLAWMLNELGPKLRTFFTVLFYAPVLSGQAYMIWQLIFNPDRYGLLNGFLLSIGAIESPISWTVDTTRMMTVLIVVQLWMSLGAGFLAFVAGLQNTDRSLIEAGAIDGIRNRFQELWFIVLPQLVPQLIFGAVMQIVSAFSVGEVSMTMIGFPSTEYAAETIITHIQDFGSIRFEMGYASALSSLLVLMMLGSNKLVNKFIGRIGH